LSPPQLNSPFGLLLYFKLGEKMNYIPCGATHTIASFLGGDRFVKIEKDSAYVWTDYDSLPSRWRKLHFVNAENISHYLMHTKPLPKK
jgi:hypothetical protein